MKTLTKEEQKLLTPNQAIELLKKGNDRFINNLKLNRNFLQQVNETSQAQYPFATILNCIDSRITAELIFDQGLGDIFSIRVAGNIINEDILGSMEFACKIAGSKLIAVIGHTHCGAIHGACDQVKMGHLTSLLKKIEPVIDSLKHTVSPEKFSKNDFRDYIASMNVLYNINQIREKSPILNELVKANKIAIIGGMYHLDNGKVDLFESDKPLHPAHFEQIGFQSI